MPTTETALFGEVLSQFDRHGVPWVVLHGAAQLAEGLVESDLDVAIAQTVSTFLPILHEAQARAIYCVMLWRYDCDSASAFLMRPEGGGAQLDIVYGAGGRLGVRPAEFVARAINTQGIPQLSATDQAIYLAVKSAAKGMQGRFEQQIAYLKESPDRDLAIRTLLRPSAQRTLLHYLAGAPSRRRTQLHVRSARRTYHRLVHPCGVWLHLSEASAETALRLAMLFDSVVVRAESREARFGERCRTLVDRRRPVVLVTHGGRRHRRGAINLTGHDPRHLLENALPRMAERVA